MASAPNTQPLSEQVWKVNNKKGTKSSNGGRKPAHDLRTLIGIGIKLAIPSVTQSTAVDILNYVCNTITRCNEPASQERDLCTTTLKNRCKDVMGVSWSDIRSDEEQASRALWRKIVLAYDPFTAYSIYNLTGEACDRIVLEENFKRNSKNLEKQGFFDLDIEIILNQEHHYMVPIVAHLVDLEPQPHGIPEYVAPTGMQLVGDNQFHHQIEDMSYFKPMETNDDTFDINNFEVSDEFLNQLEFDIEEFGGRD
jgi:hypothetical protein